MLEKTRREQNNKHLFEAKFAHMCVINGITLSRSKDLLNFMKDYSSKPVVAEAFIDKSKM